MESLHLLINQSIIKGDIARPLKMEFIGFTTFRFLVMLVLSSLRSGSMESEGRTSGREKHCVKATSFEYQNNMVSYRLAKVSCITFDSCKCIHWYNDYDALSL